MERAITASGCAAGASEQCCRCSSTPGLQYLNACLYHIPSFGCMHLPLITNLCCSQQCFQPLAQACFQEPHAEGNHITAIHGLYLSAMQTRMRSGRQYRCTQCYMHTRIQQSCSTRAAALHLQWQPMHGTGPMSSTRPATPTQHTHCAVPSGRVAVACWVQWRNACQPCSK